MGWLVFVKSKVPQIRARPDAAEEKEEKGTGAFKEAEKGTGGFFLDHSFSPSWAGAWGECGFKATCESHAFYPSIAAEGVGCWRWGVWLSSFLPLLLSY